jgi:VanZ family protein
MTPNPWPWRILLLLWALKIFWLSGAGFNGDQSGSLLRALFHFIGWSPEPWLFAILHTAARKGAHLVEYAVLSFLAYRSLLPRFWPAWHLPTAQWAFSIAFVYALTDEFHQMFVVGRGASLTDCLLDATGAGLAMISLYFVLNHRGAPTPAVRV